MSLTTDPHDGCLHEIGADGMQKCYLILPDGVRKNLVRPVRRTYVHDKCGTTTTMSQAIAETYAAEPSFYGATFCASCRDHYPVGPNGQFRWDESDEKVGT